MKNIYFQEEKQKNWPRQNSLSRQSFRWSRQNHNKTSRRMLKEAALCRNKGQVEPKIEMKTVAT